MFIECQAFCTHVYHVTKKVDIMIQMDDLLKTMQLENVKRGFWSQDQDGTFCSPLYLKPNIDIQTHF